MGGLYPANTLLAATSGIAFRPTAFDLSLASITRRSGNQAISTWRQVDDLRREWLALSAKQASHLDEADELLKRSAIPAANPDQASDSPDGLELLTPAGLAAKEQGLRQLAGQLQGRIDRLLKEMHRLVDLLRQMNVSYDFHTGRYAILGSAKNADAMRLAFAQWDTIRAEHRREQAATELQSRLGKPLEGLIGLLQRAQETTAPQDPADHEDRRVHAWIKTTYSVSGANGGPTKTYTGYAPVMAAESTVGGDDVVAVSLAAGLRGGWNARETAASQLRPAVVR